jgi:ferredoxin-NADP reductase
VPTWQQAVVEEITQETYRVKTFTLRPERWQPFRPGQHVRVRLTASDGYRAVRSYSLASPPEQRGTIDLTIERVPSGEVSAFFHEVALTGDSIELSGPVGGPFTWTVEEGGPLLLLAGGSGVVPLMCMLRHLKKNGSAIPVVLVYSSRSLADIIYREELDRLADEESVRVLRTLTRQAPQGWTGPTRRVDTDMLQDALRRLPDPPRVFACGPTRFVESVSHRLLRLGVAAATIRTERFGATA